MKPRMKSIAGLTLAVVLPAIVALAGCTTPASTDTPQSTQVPYQLKVEEFIKNSQTFKFDGIAGSIKFTDIVGSAKGTSATPARDWEFTVQYQSGHPGHGDRTGQVLTQVVTKHVAVVKVESGEIISAICDSASVLVAGPSPTDEEVEQAGELFIANSSTFRFDGIEGSIRLAKTEPGWTSSVRTTSFTFEYQTRHPGHGDRTGKIIAEVITSHNAEVLVRTESATVLLGICDKTWDMVNDKNPPVSAAGIVIGGGDTTLPGGPADAPRLFVYDIKRDDGGTVRVSYTAYPPSPVGDANRQKITLEFAGGSIRIGDRLEALGRIDKETNTIVVADKGDYIKTSAPQLTIVSENVNWKMGETVVAATITRPDDDGVHPGVVFVAGSGPTDREWNSPLLPGTNGTARLLAEELARNGYITIRYDKRLAGPNAQANLPLLVGKISMESHVDELAGAVDQLLARPNVNPAKVFVLANSEGNIHALNYQISREHKFAGLILEGPPGRNLADLMRAQLGAQVASLPDAAEIMSGYDRLMSNFLTGKPFVSDPKVPEGINNLVQGLYAPINLPFTREFFVLDPAPLLGKATGPTLVMIGKKDIQVDYKLDGALLETAAKGRQDVTFIYPDNANHVLKYEPRPREALSGADGLTYNASDRVVDPDALELIKSWLLKNS